MKIVIRIIKVLLLILCMISIFYFSSDNGVESSDKSHSIIYSVGELILGRELTNQEKDYYVEHYEVFVRKTAHFTIYFILGLLFISNLYEYRVIDKKSILYSIFFVFIYACSDEIHQLFIHERSGQILDVLLDTVGGSCSSYLYYLFRRKK